ncbi:ABC transporter ATP-binding protein [Mesorhizobium sp. CN2-181]|uniref:ABC transporter ATP-binding protein n=1 Tax=Mesorhizobium yinganensis TaxID=3157707 RepID=UPI0032B84DFA
MLEVRDVTVRQGAIAAVRGASLDVGAGTIVALIGANGAGKSSLLEAISGMKRPIEGRINFHGERIDKMPSHEVLARGMAHVPENRLIFTRLTVGENLAVAATAHMSSALARRRREAVLERFPELALRLDEPASVLSGGQQQLLAVARGLMTKPKLLILDEPTLGLSPIATASMFSLIADLRVDGSAILLVDQNINRTLAIADTAYLIDNGEIALSGPARALPDNPRLAEALLGTARNS